MNSTRYCFSTISAMPESPLALPLRRRPLKLVRSSSLSRGKEDMRSSIGLLHASERALSRRQFVRIAAGATSFAFSGPGLWRPAALRAQSGGAMPKPIPGGTNTPWGVFIHHYPPKRGGDLAAMDDPSQITDLDGWICDSRILGMGTGTDLKTGSAARYPFAADMGIMKGTYVGEDGKRHIGVFGFI